MGWSEGGGRTHLFRFESVSWCALRGEGHEGVRGVAGAMHEDVELHEVGGGASAVGFVVHVVPLDREDEGRGSGTRWMRFGICCHLVPVGRAGGRT